MPFIEVEQSVREKEWSMHDLHSHTHYELYFLMKGERTFFLSNALHKLSAPAIIVIPPHAMHMTEGSGFERYNVNVAPDYLNPYQAEILHKHALQIIRPTQAQAKELASLFQQAVAASRTDKHAQYILHALFSYAVYLLDNLEKSVTQTNSETQKRIPPLLLKVIDYLHEHYAEEITLQGVADTFFVSKATLMYNFKKHINCSLIDFLLNIRLTKAKELLFNSKKSIEEIAESCGFSSANYFGLIFKKKEGLSPMQYRKIQHPKR